MNFDQQTLPSVLVYSCCCNKHHALVPYSSRRSFLAVPEARKSKIKVDSVTTEGPLCSSWTFLRVSSLGRRGKVAFWCLCYKSTNAD